MSVRVSVYYWEPEPCDGFGYIYYVYRGNEPSGRVYIDWEDDVQLTNFNSSIFLKRTNLSFIGYF